MDIVLNEQSQTTDHHSLSAITFAQLVEAIQLDLSSLPQFTEEVKRRYMDLHDLHAVITTSKDKQISSDIIMQSLMHIQQFSSNQLLFWQQVCRSCLKVLSKNSRIEVNPGRAQTSGKHKIETDTNHQSRAKQPKMSRVAELTPTTTKRIYPFDKIPSAEVYEELAQHFKNSKIPYSVGAQSYITCRKRGCKFCKDMFYHTHITRCDIYNHTPCVPSGFFPHIGMRLWKILKRLHDSGTEYQCPPASSKEIRYTLNSFICSEKGFAKQPSNRSKERDSTPEYNEKESGMGVSPRYEPVSPDYRATSPDTI